MVGQRHSLRRSASSGPAGRESSPPVRGQSTGAATGREQGRGASPLPRTRGRGQGGAVLVGLVALGHPTQVPRRPSPGLSPDYRGEEKETPHAVRIGNLVLLIGRWLYSSTRRRYSLATFRGLRASVYRPTGLTVPRVRVRAVSQ